MKYVNNVFALSDILPVYVIVDGKPLLLPETNAADEYIEGAKTDIIRNQYERDEKARKKCLEIHGYTCKVCEFNFEQRYGELGKGFIHVHHKIPLSKIGIANKTNPEIDLVPVCPNCHAMLHMHSQDEPLEFEILRKLLI